MSGKNRKNVIISLLLLQLLLLAVVCTACGAASVDASDFAGYAEAQILISGLEDEDFYISVAELGELPAVSRAASATRANGDKVSITAVGPLLDTLLEEHGHRQTDFDHIRFGATDGYAITIEQNLLAKREIILAVMDGSSPLTADDQPLRVVIPGERAMYWVRHVNSISFEQGESAAACHGVLLLESACSRLEQTDYDYYGVTDQAIYLSGLVSLAEGDAAADDELIGFYAADGLEQNETWIDIKAALLKISGADAPRLVGELPEGMQFYDLVWLSCRDQRVVCLDKAVSLWGENGRLGVYRLLNHLGGVSSESYRLTTVTNESLTCGVDELEGADLFLDEEGRVVLELRDGSDVTGLLRLEAGS
ncbi:MAG: molybdopterin-dependent oxidoreductase [Firmicutes bacterium]|nr:molybdopterin-dependent oxidoreductase [Bacillota bacterium]